MKELKKLKKLADEFFEEAEKFISKQKELVIQTIPEKTIKWGPESEEMMTWYEAKKWCEEQGGRLPTRLELQCALEDEEIRKTFQSSYYWSSTEVSDTSVYYVSFSSCNAYGYGKGGSSYVRCILD